MKLGFVGVGKWAQRLATAFRACGAEIVCYDRQNVKPWIDSVVPGRVLGPAVPWFGPGWEARYMPWRSQLTDKSIDAIIAVAPPEVTTEVALAAAAAGKPVLATKPVWTHPEKLTNVWAVDFWRLWSKSHETARERIAANPDADVCINLYGNGPFRSFPGAFDWGPHVIAAVADLFPEYWIMGANKINVGAGETFRVHVADNGSDRSITLYFGNAQEGPTERSYMVGDWREDERDTRIGSEEKADVLQRFAQNFLDDIAEGFVSNRLLDLSRKSTADIRKIRELAGA